MIIGKMDILINELSREESKSILNSYSSIMDKYQSERVDNRICSVCASVDFDEIGPDIVRLANTKLYISEKDIRLRHCNGCGCIRTSHLYPESYYFEYLNKFYGVVPGIVAPDMIKKARLRGDLLKKITTDLSKDIYSILEISSYDGVTLHFLKKFFTKPSFFGPKPINVFGIEPTLGAVSFAEKTYPDLKGSMINKLAEEVDYPSLNKKFDAVVFSYALRMMSNPKKVIKKIKKQLNSGAIILIHEGTLINTTMTLNQEQQYYRQFSQQKINYFTSQGLRYFMENNGFRYLESITHDASDLQGALLAFVLDEDIAPDKDLIVTSKTVSSICVNFWSELQKNKNLFYHYLKTVG